MRRLHPALLLLAGLLQACAAIAPYERPATEQERAEYGESVAVLVDDPDTAERRLEAFVRSWPESPLADDARMRLAEIALARGDRETALERYRAVVHDHPGGDRANAARVQIARLEAARGDTAAAATVLRDTNLSRLSASERQAAYRVLADIAPDPVSRLRWLARLRAEETDPDAVALVDVEIDELLLEMNVRDLDRAAEEVGRHPPAARVRLKQAELMLDDGDLKGASQAALRARRLTLDPDQELRFHSISERIRIQQEIAAEDDAELPTFADVMGRKVPSTLAATGTLGVVLPLSGDFAHFGEASLQGVLLAAGVFGASGDPASGPHVRVVIRDSGGRPERAAAAVRELALQEDVSAVIGPLLRAECEAAATAATALNVPLIALTAREEISRGRPHVFRVRTMPREEVRELVRRARADGAERFAILYPRDAYGRGSRRLFWEAVEEQGGEIVGVASYEPDANDFAGPIRRLVGYTLLTPEEKQALKERDDMERRARRLPPAEASALREEARALTGPDEQLLPPIVDFDALFIPESHEKVVLIAPQLAFHEAIGTRLLGPSGWYHPDLVAIGRGHVEGALFTAHFYPESTLPFVRSFTDRYRQAFDREPDEVAAQAYDAANLVLVQLARGYRSREEVREGVLSIQAYPGVTGVLSMRADGNARKRPFLLGVERGHVIQVE